MHKKFLIIDMMRSMFRGCLFAHQTFIEPDLGCTAQKVYKGKLLVILLRYSKSQNKTKFKIKSACGRAISFTKMKKLKDDFKFLR